MISFIEYVTNCSLKLFFTNYCSFKLSNCQIVRSKKPPTEWAAGIFYSCPAKFKTGIIFCHLLSNLLAIPIVKPIVSVAVISSFVFLDIHRDLRDLLTVIAILFQNILKDSSKLKLKQKHFHASIVIK
jgi:hypothetical protein